MSNRSDGRTLDAHGYQRMMTWSENNKLLNKYNEAKLNRFMLNHPLLTEVEWPARRDLQLSYKSCAFWEGTEGLQVALWSIDTLIETMEAVRFLLEE